MLASGAGKFKQGVTDMGKITRGAALREEQDRQTFEVPDGFEAVRDEQGRATGEIRPVASDAFRIPPVDGIGETIADELAAMDISEAAIFDEEGVKMQNAFIDSSNAGKPFVVRELEAKAKIYEERNKLYGDNYKRFGPIMSLMMAGQIIDCNDAHAMARLGVFVQCVSKLTRYGENFSRGGHDDSLDDTAVYAMMLKELDNE